MRQGMQDPGFDDPGFDDPGFAYERLLGRIRARSLWPEELVTLLEAEIRLLLVEEYPEQAGISVDHLERILTAALTRSKP